MVMSQKALQKKREKKKQSRQCKSEKMLTTQPQHITYSRWPLYECWVPVEIWEAGIGQVIVSRKSPLGDIAVGLYLIDTYCLGIKDCFLRLFSLSEYKTLLEQMGVSTGELQSVEPSYAKTLISQAKEYAMRIGFNPHPDFMKAQWMLKDISIDNAQVFTFGKDNKPLYIPGSNESPADMKRIMHTLQSHLDQDKYDYVLAI